MDEERNNDTIMLDNDLEKAEEELSETDQSDETPPGDIVAFNELRSCADLFRLYEARQLNISPDYQRDLVWPASSQTRFIDSLTKQLPIPSMCISLDYKTEDRQVVDGLQRMSSIIRFLSEKQWRLSNLEDIDQRISNKTVEYIERRYPSIYSRVENTTIPVTVLRCDLSKRNHQEYLFTIFHRLNTGGLKLNNQEIRNCVYTGPFNRLLKEIVSSEVFVQTFSINKRRKPRQSNEELVLRILAFSENIDEYKGPLSKHLNSFMAKYREGDGDILEIFRQKFMNALKMLYTRILDEEPLPRLSKATTEAIMVGIIVNFDNLKEKENQDIKEMYNSLRLDPLFSLEALKAGLAAKEGVIARLTRATDIFGQC